MLGAFLYWPALSFVVILTSFLLKNKVCNCDVGLVHKMSLRCAIVMLNGVVMEEECIVAAGSVVSPGTRVPRRTLMMGVPARPKRALTDEDLTLIHRPTQNYVRLAAQYREDK